MSVLKRVMVGMSGGVDSAVAAWLLKRNGHEVVGVFMKNWQDENDSECTTRQDMIDAAAAADVIGIPFDVVDFSATYRERVFSDFLNEYRLGRTPNPDVFCNSEIKFGAFLDYAIQSDVESLATGHYAQKRMFQENWQLLKAEDDAKDQSYFLYRLNQEQLAKALFPIGHMIKREVRKLAEEIGLSVHDKKDSTGICFIGERSFPTFLESYLGKSSGEIRSLDNDELLGEHMGLYFHTIGQRQGLGLGGIKNRQEAPWFVAKKDLLNNRLYVVQGHHHPALYRITLVALQLNWIANRNPHTHWVYAAKNRYRMPDAPCTVESLADDQCEIAFAAPQWAVTPGQSFVLYESRVCLGGGIIA